MNCKGSGCMNCKGDWLCSRCDARHSVDVKPHLLYVDNRTTLGYTKVCHKCTARYAVRTGLLRGNRPCRTLYYPKATPLFRRDGRMNID